MKFFEKLKSVFSFKIPHIGDIKILNITVKIDRSFYFNNQDGMISINPDKLEAPQRQILMELLASDGLNEGKAILQSGAASTVNDVRGCLPAIEPTVQFFSPVIPQTDLPLLRACLYLREKFKRGENVEPLKTQIVNVYGVRGRNFANLCSAEYLESWFKPLLNQLMLEYPDDMATVKQKFQQSYNVVVENIPWTVFVSAAMHDKLAVHIIKKMQTNLKNGIDYLNVHGLGDSNVKRILASFPEIQKEIGAVPVHVDQNMTRISARLQVQRQLTE